MPLATSIHSTKRAMPPLPRVLPKSVRRKIEDALEKHLTAVEAITGFLDQVDGDADAEPSLGWSVGMGYGAANDDREEDGDGREPSLGWAGDIDQSRAHRNYQLCERYGHFETEHDGREPYDEAGEHDIAGGAL